MLEGWKKEKIGNLMEVTSVKRVHESDWTSNGIPFYRAREIVALFNKEKINPLHISVELYNTFSKISGKIEENDLLVTGVGTIGVPYLVKKDDKFYFKDGNIIWFKNRNAIDGKFFYYLFTSPLIQKQIYTSSGKGTVGTYTIGSAKETVVVLPLKSEQKAIAKTLTNIDNLIDSLQRIIEKKEKILNSTINELLINNPHRKKWTKKPLNKILKYEQPTKYIINSTEYLSNGIPVLTAGKTFLLGYTNEQDGIYDKGKCIIFDDFTTATKNVDFKFKVKSSAMKILTPINDSFDLDFVYYMMNTIRYEATSHQRHWISIYSKFEIAIPDNIQEQKRLAKIILTMEHELKLLKQKWKKYKKIKEGMIEDLLTGKVRLNYE